MSEPAAKSSEQQAVEASDAPAYFAGLDLGQMQDFSAVVGLERTRPAGQKEYHFAVGFIHRWKLRTPYPTIADDVKAMFADPPLAGSTLIVDRTGVGTPVCDQLKAAKINARLRPYTITAGRTASGGTVPKLELVGALQTVLGTRRLKIAEGLPLAETLTREMDTLRVKTTAARNEVVEAWRERDHDDLVLALALALWYASRRRDVCGGFVGVPQVEPPWASKSRWVP